MNRPVYLIVLSSLICVLAAAGCGSGPSQYGPDSDDCAKLLEGGVFNKASVSSMKQYSAMLRERLNWSNEQLQKEASSGKGGISVALLDILKASGEGSGDRSWFNSMKQSFASSGEYVVSEAEFTQLNTSTASQAILDSWNKCIEDSNRSGAVRFKRVGTSSDTTVLSVASDKEFRVNSFYVGGGKLQNNTLTPGSRYQTGTTISIAREKQGELMPDLVVILETDNGVARLFEKSNKEAVAKAEADRVAAAAAEAARVEAERREAARLAVRTNGVLASGFRPDVDPIRAVLPGNTKLVGLTVYCSSWINGVELRGSDGSTVLFGNSDCDSSGGCPEPITFGEGEVLTGFRGTKSNEIDSIEVITSKRVYGPYGARLKTQKERDSKYFDIYVSNSKRVAGLHGSNKNPIARIGFVEAPER